MCIFGNNDCFFGTLIWYVVSEFVTPLGTPPRLCCQKNVVNCVNSNIFFHLKKISVFFPAPPRQNGTKAKLCHKVCGQGLCICFLDSSMVFILDGNSELGANVLSNLRYLIYLRHFIRSRAVTNRIFYTYFFIRAQRVLS